jgi:hypothetical protein
LQEEDSRGNIPRFFSLLIPQDCLKQTRGSQNFNNRIGLVIVFPLLAPRKNPIEKPITLAGKWDSGVGKQKQKRPLLTRIT